MSIKRALVDEARVLRREPTATKVEGTTTFVETTGSWFRARLSHTSVTAENQIEGAGRSRARVSPLLTYGVSDDRGDEVDLRADDRVEVRSDQLGRALWQVDGEPQPLRKRRRVIGHVANVTQVREG